MLVLMTIAVAAPPAWSLSPFGVGVYLHDRPVRGVLYSATQAIGWSALGYGAWQAGQNGGDEPQAGFYQWQAVSAIGASVGFGSWLVSMIDAGRLHELEGAAAAGRLRTWDQQRIAAQGSTDD